MKESAIREKILSVIGGGDILLIVPPFVTTRTPILGPHILQQIAEEQSYKTDILYLNLLLASIIGVERYENISYGQPFRMLGERLFARSAYGLPPLGLHPELCDNPTESVFGDGQPAPMEAFEYKYYTTAEFELETYQKIEGICASLIEEVSHSIATLSYQMVGCSTNWEQNNCCIALLNRVKTQQPDVLTMIGGSNCEAQMAEGIASLSHSIDYIFSGESEETFVEFLKLPTPNPSQEGNVAASLRKKLPAQQILTGAPVNDVDSIPLPDYTHYIQQRVSFLGEHASEEWKIGYETSRGCWWGKCYFCGLNGTARVRFREKSARNAIHDVRQLKRQYPEKTVVMVDKVMPRGYEKKLLAGLSEYNDSPPLHYGQRSDLTLHDLLHLKHANIQEIQPGIEALSTDLLRLMNKGITAKQNLLLLRNARSVGIYVVWNLLWGFPGDKTAHYEDTLRLLPALRHLYPPNVFRHICIDRFSPYFQHPHAHQISNLRPWNTYHSIYPEWAAVDKLAYRFIGDYPCAAHEHPELIREIAREVELWHKQWKQTSLTMTPFGDFYMIYDNRESHGKSKTHVIDAAQAKAIMTSSLYEESESVKWAVEEKLGVVVDSWYVPLVTASPELLLEFEELQEFRISRNKNYRNL